MLQNEAKWYARQIAAVGDANAFPMLNVGSHTHEFRTREQPWIDRYLFAGPRSRGCEIVHTDLRDSPGVDLVGDLTDPAFLAMLTQRKFKSVVLSNLLEHVTDRDIICRAVVEAVLPGGYIFVSGPHTFPYHPDPIDNMYRPEPAELAAAFPGTELVAGEVVRGGTLATYLFGRLTGSPGMLVRTLLARKKQVVARTEQGMSAAEWVPWLWRSFRSSCVVVRKKGEPGA